METELENLKKEIVASAREIAERYVKAINENGGRAEIQVIRDDWVEIDIDKQPEGIPRGFNSKVRLSSISAGYFIDLPAISTTASIYGPDEAEEYKRQLDICIKIIRQAGSVKEILKKFARYRELKEQLKQKKLEKLAEEFQSLPEEEVLWEKGGVKVVKVRSFDGIEKNSLRGSVSLKIVKDGRKHSFWVGDFITSSGAVQRKKFMEWKKAIFGEYTAEVASHLKEWHHDLEAERRKYFRRF